MSKLTRKLWKVSDAVEVKQETTTKGDSMQEQLLQIIKNNKGIATFVGIVLIALIANWMGL
jgi:plastocyanin domain-containing protein